MRLRLVCAVLAGVAAIPLAVSASAFVNYVLYPERFADVSVQDRLEGIFAWSLGGAGVGLVVLTLYGLPVFLILRRYGWANFASCTLLAILPPLAYVLAFDLDATFFAHYSVFALASAWAFWLVARRIPRHAAP